MNAPAKIPCPFADAVAAIKQNNLVPPIFPCRSGAKEPATDNGFHDAARRYEDLQRFAADHPTANIGLSLEDAGLCVIDVDGLEGENALCLLDLQHGLPPTYEVKTPRGRHLYFRGSLPASASKLGPKIDTRGRGSYVLAPGSIVNGIRYERANDLPPAELPSWIGDAIREASEATRAVADVELDLTENIERARQLLRSYVERGHVAIEGQGGDNRTYQVACEVLNLGLSPECAFELMRDEWNAACVPPWPADELAVKVRNAADYAQNEPGAWAAQPSTEAFAHLAKHGEGSAQINSAPVLCKTKFRVLMPKDMRVLPAPAWLIPNILPANSVIMFFGAHASYKTFIALELSFELATGKSNGRGPIAQCAVAYCAGEAPIGIARKRFPAWMQHRQIAEPDGVPFALIPAVPLVSTTSDVDALIAALKGTELRFALIVIDTVARALGGLDENSAKDAGLLLAAAEKLRDTFDCSVLLIHHTGKDENRGARGSSALLAGVDAAFEIKADTDVLAVTLRCEKMKDSDPPAPLRFKGTRTFDSVVFDPMPEGEFAALTRSNTSAHIADVGVALRALQAANGGKPVTTRVLATELARQVSPDAPEEVIRSKERALQRQAKDRFRAYVAQLGEGHRGHPTLWAFPNDIERGPQ